MFFQLQHFGRIRSCHSKGFKLDENPSASHQFFPLEQTYSCHLLSLNSESKLKIPNIFPDLEFSETVKFNNKLLVMTASSWKNLQTTQSPLRLGKKKKYNFQLEFVLL